MASQESSLSSFWSSLENRFKAAFPSAIYLRVIHRTFSSEGLFSVLYLAKHVFFCCRNSLDNLFQGQRREGCRKQTKFNVYCYIPLAYQRITKRLSFDMYSKEATKKRPRKYIFLQCASLITTIQPTFTKCPLWGRPSTNSGGIRRWTGQPPAPAGNQW